MNFPKLIQTASLFGLFFLSIIALSVPVTLFIAIDFFREKFAKKHIIICSILMAIFLINLAYGWYRLANAPVRFSSDNKIKIVQHNISTLLKRETMDYEADKIINLASFNPDEDQGLLYVLLPESALSRFTRNKIGKLIKRSLPFGSYLIAGGDRVDYTNKVAWNSIYVVNYAGQVIDVYDKTHPCSFW